MLNDFNEILEGRKSVKGFDPDYKIPHEEMNEMIAKATKAPSSVNMQPWRFVVVESYEAKAKLRPLIQFNTNQNDTSSAMIVILGIYNAMKKANIFMNKRLSMVTCHKKLKNKCYRLF